jgi:photosystem II stability/assembly factor-like uncharacterized protein
MDHPVPWNDSLNRAGSQLLVTNDGGAHWSSVGTDSETLDRIKFVSLLEGWAISETGSAAGSDSDTADKKVLYSVLHTTDAGADWSVQWEGSRPPPPIRIYGFRMMPMDSP